MPWHGWRLDSLVEPLQQSSTIIVLTRPYSDSCALSEELEQFGIWSFIEPMLEIEYAADAREKLRKLDLSQYSGIILTSRHALHLLEGVDDLRGIPIYAVGSETAQMAESMGFDVALHAPSAAELAAMMTLKPASGRLLYPSAEVVAFDFAKVWPDLTRIITYMSIPAPGFSPEFVSGLMRGDFTAVTFFSRRTASTFMKIIQELGIERLLINVDALTLSPEIADTLPKGCFRGVYHATGIDRMAILKLISNKYILKS